MIPISEICIILFAHWVGDYVLQFNNIANHKSESVYWLSVHVLIYAGVLFVASLFLFSILLIIKYVVINAILHFITDFITSRLAVRYKTNQHLFFIIVGFDQFIHGITLLGTAVYVFG